MRYENIVHAKFVDRPNRFIAHVRLCEGVGEEATVSEEITTVHVKNTGRCKELLLPGIDVILEKASNPNRKTQYDLVMVWKEGVGWINIDSQAPNKIAREWLEEQDFDYIKPEYTYGKSRIDFYMERGAEKLLMEVKGCTLEIDGIGYFPDAPTERGIKHLRELAGAAGNGYRAMVAFVIQMEGIREVRPNVATHPEFGVALEEAKAAGVEVVLLPCTVTEDEVRVKEGLEME